MTAIVSASHNDALGRAERVYGEITVVVVIAVMATVGMTPSAEAASLVVEIEMMDRGSGPMPKTESEGQIERMPAADMDAAEAAMPASVAPPEVMAGVMAEAQPQPVMAPGVMGDVVFGEVMSGVNAAAVSVALCGGVIGGEQGRHQGAGDQREIPRFAI